MGSSTSPSMMTINSYARIMRDEPPFGPGRRAAARGPAVGQGECDRGSVPAAIRSRSAEHDEGVSHVTVRRAARPGQQAQPAARPDAELGQPAGRHLDGVRVRAGRRVAGAQRRVRPRCTAPCRSPTRRRRRRRRRRSSAASPCPSSRSRRTSARCRRTTIPSAPPRSVTPISPRARSSSVSATHRHSSQTVPSASVTTAAVWANPTGTTPAVVGGADAAAGGAVADRGSCTWIGRRGSRSRCRNGRRWRRRGRSSSSSPHAAATETSDRHRADQPPPHLVHRRR